MKKIILLLIFILATSMFCLFSCSDNNEPVNESSSEFNFLPDSMTLYVGDVYKFKTIDGIYHDTYRSEDESVIKITSNGLADVLSVGKTNVVVNIDDKDYKCAVTIIDTISIEKEDKSIYSIAMNNVYEIKTSSSNVIIPTIYKDGLKIDDEVKWNIPQNDLFTYEIIDNKLSIVAKSNTGYVKISATYGEYVATAVLKIYNESSYLEHPQNQHIDNNKLVWDSVDGADKYLVSFDFGKTWTDVGNNTQCDIESNTYMFLVDVVAVAPIESEKINSVSYVDNVDCLNIVPSAFSNITDNNDGTFDVVVGNDEEKGKKAFNLYVNSTTEPALILGMENSAKLLEDLSFSITVKSDVDNTIYFLTKSSDEQVSYFSYKITANEWTKIGYNLNGYDDCMLISADVDFSYKDAVVLAGATEYKQCTLYNKVSDALKLIVANELDSEEKTIQEKIVFDDFKYLKETERNNLSNEYKSVIDEILSIKFVDGIFDFTKLSGGRPSVNYDVRYIEKDDASSIKVEYTGFNVGFDALMPADADYDYYVFKVYSRVAQPTLFCEVLFNLIPGWNYLTIQSEEFINNKHVFYINAQVYLGSFVGYNASIYPEFIDSSFDYALMTKSGVVEACTINYNEDYIYEGEEASVKVSINNGHASPQDANVYYSALLPTDEPSYDSYVWHVYSDKGVGTLFGSKSVTLNSGWNTIQLSYDEIVNGGNSRIYLYCGPGSFNVYLGNLVGVVE